MTEYETKSLALLERIATALEWTAKTARASPAAAPRAVGGGAVFGAYGRNKGGAVSGASLEDLTYYGDGCRRTLGDPGKERFHAREQVLLAAIEAEVARQGGSVPPHGDADAPPPGSNDEIPF